MVEEIVISSEALSQFTKAVFMKMGCNETDASTATSVLISADLRGIDSHGVARLSGYVRLWEAKRVNPNPNFIIERESPSTATLNADAALGLISGPYAMQIAIKKASSFGLGMVAVNNSNHFGIGAYHALLAVEQKMIGVCMTNASPLVAPVNSKERMLGTNPITFAIPAGKNPPFVSDMATSAAANGKLELLQRKNKPTPDGWLQDSEGKNTNDAYALKNGGALIPLGSDVDKGYHKGYCLGATVDILSGVLSGANYGPWVPPFVSFLPLASNPVGLGIGHIFMAINVDAFRPIDEFLDHMDRWINRFRSATPINKSNPVLIPGDPEVQVEKERKSKGIPLLDPVYQDLKQLSKKMHLDFI